jgi:hypothetical protein
MGNCKDCKWWKGVLIAGFMRKCNQPEAIIHDYGDTIILEDGLQIESDKDFGCVVGPTFGCVNFEKAGQ